MNITELKEAAQQDMVNWKGRQGFSEAVIDGRWTVVMAKLWGVNKPGRKEHVRFEVVDRGVVETSK